MIIKKIFFIGVLILISLNLLIAQNDKNTWIGINSSISMGELIRYGGELDGGVSYSGKGGFLIGFGFSKVLNERLDFETGLDFSRNSFTSSYIDDMGNTHENNYPVNVDLISLPLNMRFKFSKTFFVTAGIQYDQRINIIKSSGIDSQTGIGFNLKFGRDFKISENMILFVAPEVIIHGVIPIYPENHQQRLTEFGLRVSYKFGL